MEAMTQGIRPYALCQGAGDYTTHRDAIRKRRYLARHGPRERWDRPMTAGALSRWVLWNKPTLRGSMRDYARRFDLDLL